MPYGNLEKQVVERFASYIKGETLASEFSLDGGEHDHSETACVDGHEIGSPVGDGHDLHRDVRLEGRRQG
jgi:hypothetical protein